ncbi:unnamed protein product [Amoebophrya sp. A120]|nr:unnamed protein product [Amoebophrya sp. A120]|eukprot:GSA120T00010054001.1
MLIVSIIFFGCILSHFFSACSQVKLVEAGLTYYNHTSTASLRRGARDRSMHKKGRAGRISTFLKRLQMVMGRSRLQICWAMTGTSTMSMLRVLLEDVDRYVIIFCLEQ